MFTFKPHTNARQLSVIESAYSQEIDSVADHHHHHNHSSEASTERRDFAVTDPSWSSSTSSAAASPPNNLSSAISSLNLSPSRTDDSRDHDARREARNTTSKDLEKGDSETLSSDGSGWCRAPAPWSQAAGAGSRGGR